MRLIRFTFLLFFTFLFTPFCFAQQKPVLKTVLPNGLTILIQEIPDSEVTSIYACVKTGSAMEGRYLGKGISHFVEHMLFKGTAKRPVGAIAKEVKALGGYINATTSFDYTMYTLDVPKDSFSQGLDIISDMLMNSIFDSIEMEKERQVIHGEMKLYLDRPDRVLNDLVFQNMFQKHPYRHPAIGYPMLFDSITHEEINQYYKERYIPNNIIISIAGPVQSAHIVPSIQQAFKDFKPGPFIERNLPQEPVQTFPRYMEKSYPSNLIRFSLAYQGVSVLESDLYALDVLSMALGQGASSRLYKDIYKRKHLVEEDITADNYTPEDKGIFEIHGTMVKDHLDEVISSLKLIVKDIQQNGLTKEELDKTKRQVQASFIYGNQTVSSAASRAALDEALTGDSSFSSHYVELVKKVTNEDVKKVAQKYLQDDGLNVTVVMPTGQVHQKQNALTDSKKEGIKRFILDNGLRILIREDSSVLLDEVKLVLLGGNRAEQDHQGGLAKLTGKTWSKGSSKMPEEMIDQTMEQRGGRITSGATHNTLELEIEVLAEDLDFALDLLEDLVKNPSFTADAIQRQRQQMLASLEERKDDIMGSSARTLLETFYLKNSLRRDPLGNPASLAKINRQDVLDFYHSLLTPDQMVISVFGNCHTNKVLETLKRKFGSLKKGRFDLPLTAEEAPEQTRVKEISAEKEQALIIMAFKAPQLKDRDRYAMDIIENIIGGGLGGQLFVKIREELGEAYTVDAQYSPDLDTGTFMLYVLTRKEKIDSVKDVVFKELDHLRTYSISKEELEAAKSYLKGQQARSLLTNDALATVASTDELYGLGYNFYQQFDEAVNAVTSEDIKRVANQYLNISKAAIIITKPKSSQHE